MPTAKQKRLPIAIFTHEFYPKKGGIATFVESMAHAAALEGHEVTLYAPNHPLLASQKFPFHVYPLNNKGSQGWICRIATAWAMFKNRKKIQNSVLYLAEPGPIRLFMYLNLLKCLKPQKLILTLHGSEIYLFSKWFYRKLLFNSVLRACEKVTVLSRYTYELTAFCFPLAKDKLVYTPGALRIGFEPTAKAPKSSSQFTILTVARIHPRKGHIDVLKAINALGPELKHQITYKILGPTVRPRYRRTIESYAQEHQINVDFLEEVPDSSLPDAYSQADAFVMASQRYKHSVEGFGLVFLEASASQLPIIAYNSGGVAEAVEHGKTGILVDPGDINGLANAIQELMNNTSLQDALGQFGKQKAYATTWAHNIQVAFN